MTQNQPENALEPPNATKTVDCTPGAVEGPVEALDLAAIEELSYMMLRNRSYNWDELQVLEAIDDLVAEVKRLRYLIPIIERNYALALEGLRKSQQTGKGFKCACCGEWQPDGVCHPCGGGSGREGEN